VLSRFYAKEKRANKSHTIFHFNNFSRWLISCQQGSRHIRDFFNVTSLPVLFVIIDERQKGKQWSCSLLTNLFYNNPLLSHSCSSRSIINIFHSQTHFSLLRKICNPQPLPPSFLPSIRWDTSVLKLLLAICVVCLRRCAKQMQANDQI